jgi:hypothetical protein
MFHKDAVERDDIGTEAEKRKLAKVDELTKLQKARGRGARGQFVGLPQSPKAEPGLQSHERTC